MALSTPIRIKKRRVGHKSVNLVKNQIMAGGRSEDCSKDGGSQRRESNFGCATCMISLCRDKCHDFYKHRYHQIMADVSE